MNTLTIDFDIVMAPDIQLYNGLVPGINWKELTKYPQLAVLRPNCFIYTKLTNFLLKLIKNNPKFFLIQDHGMAAKIIEPFGSTNLINIDHHHDIAYKDGPRASEQLTCANWVEWLYQKNLLENYYWICDKQSKDCEFKVDFEYEKFLIEDFSLDFYNFDVVILCLSEPWVPPYVRDLFYLWSDILKNNGYDNKIDFTVP